MKTSCELEKKLKKLPTTVYIANVPFTLDITKVEKVIAENSWLTQSEILWNIRYLDLQSNACIDVLHQSIQAAVDIVLREIKTL